MMREYRQLGVHGTGADRFLAGLFGASLLLLADTDLGSLVIAVSGLLLINGGLRTARAYRSIHSRNTVVATPVPEAGREAAS